VQRKLERSDRLRRVVNAAKGNARATISGLYLTVLSREAVPEEVAAAEAYFKKAGPQRGAADLAWALVNSKEFLYRH